jgi:hypothetical protein
MASDTNAIPLGIGGISNYGHICLLHYGKQTDQGFIPMPILHRTRALYHYRRPQSPMIPAMAQSAWPQTKKRASTERISSRSSTKAANAAAQVGIKASF